LKYNLSTPVHLIQLTGHAILLIVLILILVLVLVQLLLLQDQVILRATVSRPVCLGVRPSSVAHNQIVFTIGHLWSLCCGAPSLMRGRVCNLLVQFTVTLGPKSRRTHYHILLSHLRLLEPGGPSLHIYIPGNRVAQLYPWALGSLFVASYDLQGGILTLLLMSILLKSKSRYD
jgi:hypothetical protein